MATHDPEFYESPKFSPEPDELRPRQRGCFFYGCVIASVLIVLLILALAVGSLPGLSRHQPNRRGIHGDGPARIAQTANLRRRAKERGRIASRRSSEAVKEGTATEPLILTGEDLNALVEDTPELKGRVYFTIEEGKIKGQVSIPLSTFMDIGMTRGRYLNGEAEFKASLSDGVLVVTLDSIEVNGKRPPEEAMSNIRQQNLAKDAYKDPDNAEMIRRFESIEIKDGKLIITPRPKAAAQGRAERSRNRRRIPSPPRRLSTRKTRAKLPRRRHPLLSRPRPSKAATAPAAKESSESSRLSAAMPTRYFSMKLFSRASCWFWFTNRGRSGSYLRQRRLPRRARPLRRWPRSRESPSTGSTTGCGSCFFPIRRGPRSPLI